MLNTTNTPTALHNELSPGGSVYTTIYTAYQDILYHRPHSDDIPSFPKENREVVLINYAIARLACTYAKAHRGKLPPWRLGAPIPSWLHHYGNIATTNLGL